MMYNIICLDILYFYLSQGFGSIMSYPTDTDPPKYALKYKYQNTKFNKNASDNIILELGRNIIKSEQFKK